MVATHHNKKFFSCNECGQDFVSKWRVNKHMTIHQDMPKRKCHYFNNGMICLFIEHGCKFYMLNQKSVDLENIAKGQSANIGIENTN